MSDSGKVEFTDRETVIAEVSRASGVLMALYSILEDRMANEHVDLDGAQLNKLMGDTLDGLNRIADYHREW